MHLRDQILQQALTLSAEDREYLADMVERSLETNGFQPPELAAAWSQEINRRVAAFEQGESTAVGLDAAIKNIRHALEASRSEKADS